MITARIHAHALQTPQRPAIVWNGITLSYLRLAQGIAHVYHSVRRERLAAGSTVVVVMHSLLESWFVVLALQALGLRTVCARSVPEAQQLGLRDVVALAICARKIAAAQNELGGWSHLPQLTVATQVLAHAPDIDISVLATGSPAGGHILYTSGTTGTPKKLLDEFALAEARCDRRAQADGMSPEWVCHVIDFGLWTAIGYRRPLLMWHVGACVVIDQRSDWPLHLGEHGVTQLALVPARLAQALAALPPDHARQRGWRFSISVGGGLLSPELVRQTAERVCRDLSISYASTELSRPALRSRITDPDDAHWLQVLPGRSVEILSEDGRPCASGVEGQLRIRLDPLDARGYLDDPATTARMFRDGWFHPGDLAVHRPDGRIRILGRVADVINVRGIKMASAPIEEKVREALDVTTVCAFSGPDSGGEDVIVLALETPRLIGREQLQRLARDMQGLGKLRFVQLVEFPRTRTGTAKVDRLALHRLIRETDSARRPPP